jgi:membrane-bound lytic murein transglycosylase D
LPKETQNYVPSILAIIFISKDPEKYGFTVKPESSFDWTIKEIDKSVSIEDVARCSKIDKKVLFDYNPELLKEFIYVGENESYKFRMPKGCDPKFDSLFVLIDDAKLDQVLVVNHKVRRGESLWYLAKKNQTTITAICELNNLDRNKPLKLGKTIKIPIGGDAKDFNKPKKKYYKVRSGDTLSEIAEKHRISVKKLKRLNNIRGDVIRIGQKIRVK